MNQTIRWILLLLLLSSSAFSQSFNNEWIDYNKGYYKFKVFGFGTDAAGAPITKGMVRIPYSTLQAVGLHTFSPQYFQLWRDGQEVPIYVSSNTAFGASDYIEFWGEINNGKLDTKLYRVADYQLSDKWSLQTDTAAYFLTINATSVNRRLTGAANNLSDPSLLPTPFFMYTVGRYFRAGDISNGFYAAFDQKQLYSSSYDKGEGWLSRVIRPVACGGATSLPQNFTALQPYLVGPDMTVKVNAVGNAQNSRVVKVLLNNDSVTLFQMDYTNYLKVQEQVPVNKISSGSAAFTIVNESPSGCDEMKVASIELTYPRKPDFGGASVLEFSAGAATNGRLLKITNFNHNGIAPVLYDIANGKRYVADITNTDTVKVALQSSSVPYQLVLTTQSGTYYKTITSLEEKQFTNYANGMNQGDYLIISNPLIFGSGANNFIEQYKQYRSSAAGGSYHVQVVDINDITDQFAWGVKKHPLAIKNFLRFARSKFAAPPKFAFLIGKGVTYNLYRANESNPAMEQQNLVPTWGYPASDNLLASDDFNAVPATPIGRLSVISANEVGDYLAKVKQYDSAQVSASHSIADKGWMKNVLQIAGANDLVIGAQIDGYLAGYSSIISDTAFGANVKSYSKTSDPVGYTDALDDFKHTYEGGASLISYFGHSTSSSLDFNLDHPENYSNEKKYPVFIANGCSAGNNYDFEASRFTNTSTISERFVLAPGKGAIGYLASTHFGVPNYLNSYTRQFYKAIGSSMYNNSIGDIIKEGISRSLDSIGNVDFYGRVHAETYAWHGDPAIRFNTVSLPDYAVEEPQIKITPSFISTADTRLFVQVKVFNLGKAVDSAVSLQLSRKLPNGNSKVVAVHVFPSITSMDSLTIEVPVVGNTEVGTNVFTASVNYNTKVPEITNTNNTASTSVYISEDEIRPVYPYNYAIINHANAVLVASTANPLSPSRLYLLELDTTALFNSPAKVATAKLSSGGVVEFNPGVTFSDSVTYYWRVSPAGLNVPNWRQFSFMYRAGANTGFRQGHLYQNLESKFINIKADSTTGKLSFTNQKHNLFITNAIYPTSGTEDAHFSVSVDGSSYIRSACAGSSIIINVFDSLTFQPWKNTTQPFHAAASCAAGREYNFEYQYRTAASRKNAMDFLDSIPAGSIVSVRLVLDPPYNVYAANWAADTTIYGSKNSLYHRLKAQGFADIDSFYFPRTWAFIYRKNDPSFGPVSGFSDGLNDKMILSKDATTPNVKGTITSPVFGPALSWSQVKWNGYSNEINNDAPSVEVIGIRPDKQEVVLYTLAANQHSFDISAVNAAAYPRMKLRMQNVDTATGTPYQLQYWQVFYTPAREGAIAANLYFNIPDSIGVNGALADTLHIGVAFKNVSKAGFDSLAVKVVLYDTLNNAFPYIVGKMRPLPADDTIHLDAAINIHNLSGWYNVYIDVNPNLQQPEQFSFNNFLYKRVFINPPAALPVSLLDFAAKLTGADVETSWKAATNPNIDRYIVQHSSDGLRFSNIGDVLSMNGPGVNSYQFLHKNVAAGKHYYRLQVVERNGNADYSATRLVTVGKQLLVMIFPNPVINKLQLVTGGKAVNMRITTAAGQQVWQQSGSAGCEVDMSRFSPGVYLLTVQDGSSVSTYKLQKQ